MTLQPSSDDVARARPRVRSTPGVFAALMFGLGVAAATPATADDLAALSRIEAVTVFPRGAEVTRSLKIKIPAGQHVVTLDDLPAQAVGSSIRVEGKATGQLLIGAVDHRRSFIIRGAADQASARRSLELEIERLQDERAVVEAAVETAEAQAEMIRNLVQLPLAQAGGQAAAPRPDWSELYGLIGSRLVEARQKALDSKVKLRALDRRLADLSNQLSEAAPKRTERTEVKIHVSAAGPLEAELTVRYQVNDAGWQPRYDARLETGARNVAPKLTLVRRAAIRQRTGEPWTDVALQLSTARPAAGTTAPTLRPVTVDIQLDMPRPAPVAAAPPPAARMRSAESAESAKVADAAPMQIGAVEAAAVVDTGAYAATFAVKERLTLPETGEDKSVLVDEQALEPTLVVRSVPRLDPKAYLYAKVVMPKTAPYLPGPIALFRDRTYAGQGNLPQLAPGESHEIGFGADDLVRVRHAIGDERRGEAGLISSTRTDERTFRIVVRNLHERSIAFSIQDQIPVSLNQEIKVDLTGKTPPTRRDVEEKRGVLAWEDKLNPDEERTIEFGYRMSWPANRSIVYGR